MREIIMKSISAGPDGIFHPGTRRNLSDSEAAAHVKSGYAEYATVKPESVAVIVPDEIEIVEPEETANIVKPEEIEIKPIHTSKKGRPKKQ
jgi:hypothetical protein